MWSGLSGGKEWGGVGEGDKRGREAGVGVRVVCVVSFIVKRSELPPYVVDGHYSNPLYHRFKILLIFVTVVIIIIVIIIIVIVIVIIIMMTINVCSRVWAVVRHKQEQLSLVSMVSTENTARSQEISADSSPRC